MNGRSVNVLVSIQTVPLMKKGLRHLQHSELDVLQRHFRPLP